MFYQYSIAKFPILMYPYIPQRMDQRPVEFCTYCPLHFDRKRVLEPSTTQLTQTKLLTRFS